MALDINAFENDAFMNEKLYNKKMKNLMQRWTWPAREVRILFAAAVQELMKVATGPQANISY